MEGKVRLDWMGNTNPIDGSAPRAQDEKRSKNGLPVAQKVKKSELTLPSKSNNIIGLDFGTSTLVVSYVTRTKPEPRLVKILEVDIDYYSPTVLFIDDNNVEIGNEALLRYASLDVDNFKCITFFEKVKLELQHNKVYTLQSPKFVYSIYTLVALVILLLSIYDHISLLLYIYIL